MGIVDKYLERKVRLINFHLIRPYLNSVFVPFEVVGIIIIVFTLVVLRRVKIC